MPRALSLIVYTFFIVVSFYMIYKIIEIEQYWLLVLPAFTIFMDILLYYVQLEHERFLREIELKKDWLEAKKRQEQDWT